MKLLTIAPSNDGPVNRWLTQRENFQWLDFGCGRQELTSLAIKMMMAKATNLVRLFTDDEDEDPIGIVALCNISEVFRTGMLWYVLGEKALSGRRYTARAVNEILTLGFCQMGLRSVTAWAVESNTASLRILEINHFKLMGRQRLAHQVADRIYDRLHFDLTAEEHQPIAAESRSVKVARVGHELIH
jgi:RimJ/RimL family protein N-acetyltransferase